MGGRPCRYIDAIKYENEEPAYQNRQSKSIECRLGLKIGPSVKENQWVFMDKDGRELDLWCEYR